MTSKANGHLYSAVTVRTQIKKILLEVVGSTPLVLKDIRSEEGKAWMSCL